MQIHLRLLAPSGKSAELPKEQRKPIWGFLRKAAWGHMLAGSCPPGRDLFVHTVYVHVHIVCIYIYV